MSHENNNLAHVNNSAAHVLQVHNKFLM